MGKPTVEQLAKINQLALVPLSESDTYTFPAKLVGDNVIPNRFYRLTPNFITKMAGQVKQGVSLLLDHSWANLGVMTIPLGRTYDSRLQQDGDELALYADHYMKLGQDVNGIKTDQIADGIDSGTIFDTSIGFIGTKHLCSICGNNYYNYDACQHIRGRMYDDKQCIVDIDDGDLMENSLVFDGAYPGAGVVGLSKQGNSEGTSNYRMLTEDDESHLKLAVIEGGGSVFYSFSKKSGLVGYVQKQQQQTNNTAETLAKGDESMDGKETQVQNQVLQQAQAALSAANGLLGQIKTALGVTEDGGILAKLTALSAQAQVGESYKVKVLEEALGAGVRAQGEAFNVDAMKAALSNLPVSEIEKVRDSYNAQAKAILGAGGRQTQGGDANLPEDPTKNAQANSSGEQKTPEQLKQEASKEAVAALKRTGNAHLVKEAN